MSAGSSTLSAHASDLSSDLRDGIYKTGIDSSITYSSPGTGFQSLGLLVVLRGQQPGWINTLRVHTT